MKSKRTFKLKIYSGSDHLLPVAIAYQNAANWLSRIVFDRHRIQTAPSLSREFYSTIRENFKLPSQVTCSLFRHVVATYRTMKANKEWSLAKYKRLVIPVVWNRDFYFNKKGLAIWKQPIKYSSAQLPKGVWCDSKLKLIGNTWYLCLTVEIDIPNLKITGGIVGVDRGQKNILCAVDPKTNKTLYVKGGPLNHRRLRIRQVRAKVASVGSRSAHRLLRRLSGKEAAVTQNMMHVASKRLVAFADKVGARTIVWEDLNGFRKNQTKENKKLHHKQRARNNRWPYAVLEFFSNYKAMAKGIEFGYVPARNTSRGCPKCGHVSKSNRHGLAFRCELCGHQDNADRVGATNVGLRMLLQRQATEERAAINRLKVAGSSTSYKPTRL